MNPFEVEYSRFDHEGYRARVVGERHRLERLAEAEKVAGFMDLYYVTMGRASGLSLALSHLDEYLVKEKNRAKY